MNVKEWMEELGRLHERLGSCFARKEPRQRSLEYLKGLLGSSERKNGWQIAKQAGEKVPYGMQRLLRVAEWDTDGARDVMRDYITKEFGCKGGSLIVDETSFIKKGDQ